MRRIVKVVMLSSKMYASPLQFRDPFRDFIKSIRLAAKNAFLISPRIPLLPEQREPTTYVHARTCLSPDMEEHHLFKCGFLIRTDNLYTVAFHNEFDDWFSLEGTSIPEEIHVALNMRNSYIPSRYGKLTADLNNVKLGTQHFYDGVMEFSRYREGHDDFSYSQHMLTMINSISEGARSDWILDFISLEVSRNGGEFEEWMKKYLLDRKQIYGELYCANTHTYSGVVRNWETNCNYCFEGRFNHCNVHPKSIGAVLRPKTKISIFNPAVNTKLGREFAAEKNKKKRTKRTRSSNIVYINSNEEYDGTLSAIKERLQHALFFFTAPWCESSKSLLPVIEDLDKKYRHVTVYKIDVDKVTHQNPAEKPFIIAVPTIHFYKRGRQASEVIGDDPEILMAKMKKLYG